MVVLGVVSILSLGLTEQQQQAASQQEAATAAKHAAKVERERVAALRAQELETPDITQPTDETEPSTQDENTTEPLVGRPTESTKPGNVIATDKTTGQKTYWMGNLLFSQQTVTYSLTEKNMPKITVATPDEKAITVPTPVWDQEYPIWLVPQGGSEPGATKTTWTLYVDGEEAVAGSYKAYVVTTVPSETGDRYEYSGYLTVNIIE